MEKILTPSHGSLSLSLSLSLMISLACLPCRFYQQFPSPPLPSVTAAAHHCTAVPLSSTFFRRPHHRRLQQTPQAKPSQNLFPVLFAYPLLLLCSQLRHHQQRSPAILARNYGVAGRLRTTLTLTRLSLCFSRIPCFTLPCFPLSSILISRPSSDHHHTIRQPPQLSSSPVLPESSSLLIVEGVEFGECEKP
uniref:Uncharacterized protein n=1 Tax=Opuntia streptacantha TaxID=393608 RepID=A0A7C8Z730_OPUST